MMDKNDQKNDVLQSYNEADTQSIFWIQMVFNGHLRVQ